MKEMNESIMDVNFEKPNSIPNSYLFQPESISRQWMLKRGKKQIYFNHEQIKKMR